MLRGTMALMIRGLRFDCRRWQMHALRFLLVAIFLFALVISWVEYVVSIGTSPGLSFFSYITYTNFAFITLGGMSFFTSAITEEKEEQTLGLLKMAGVNPLGILLGKLGPRLANALLLLAIQFPFVQLAVTLGGVHHRQIQAVYVTFTGFIFLMAGLGLLASVVARRTRGAALIVSAAIMIPLITQMAMAIFGRSGSSHPLLTEAREAIVWISIWSVVERLSAILSLGFDDSPLQLQFYCHLGGAAALFLTSWFIFEPCTRQPHTAAESGQVSRQVRSRIRLRTLGLAILIVLPLAVIVFVAYPFARAAVTGQQSSFVPVYESVVAVTLVLAVGLPLITILVAAIKRQSVGRDIGECWTDNWSLVWKDLHFVSGGAVGLLNRIILYSLITGVIAGLTGYFGNGSAWDWSFQGGWMLGVGLFAGTLELASNVGRGLRTEVQWQTLSTLALLPQSIRAMLWSKLLSGLLALIPAAIMTLIGFLLLLPPMAESIVEEIDHAGPGFSDMIGLLYLPMMITLLILEILLFVELTAFFALTLRWGYVVLALICTYFMNSVGAFAWSMFMILISVGRLGQGNTGAGLYPQLMILAPWIVATGICVALLIALYHAIESRVRHLASQS
ncbi:MAG: hypothetical protein VB861_09285 [Planctomycetaceae bacterium]